MDKQIQYYESFIQDLENKLNEDLLKKDQMIKDLNKQDNIISYLEDLINKENLEKTEIKTYTNIGCNIKHQAVIKLNSKIIFNIGSDTYLEIPYEEAIELTMKRKGLIKDKMNKIQDVISSKRSNIKVSLGILEQLNNIK